MENFGSPSYNRFNRKDTAKQKEEPYNFYNVNTKNLEQFDPQYKAQFHQDIPQPFSNDHFENQQRGFISGENKDILRHCLFIIPLIFFTVIFCLSLALVVENNKIKVSGANEAHEVMRYLALNLKKGLFEDVVSVNLTDSCPIDYYSENLGHFNALNSGCLCQDGSVHSRAYCWLKGDECTYYKGSFSKNIHFWKNRKICAKKLKAWKFVQKKTDCTQFGMNKCQDHICVFNNTCPISQIKIFKGQSQTNKEYFGEGYIFQTSRDTQQNPIVSYSVQENDYPCLAYQSRSPNSKNGKNYPLNSIPQSGCGKYGSISHFSDKIDSIELSQLFSQNGISPLKRDAPQFTKYYPDDDPFYLFGVRRIPIKDQEECLHINSGLIFELNSDLGHLQEGITGLGIFILILSLFGMILAILFLTLRFKIRFLNSKKGLGLLYIIFFITVFFVLILFIVYFHYYKGSKVEEGTDTYNKIVALKCFETPGITSAAKDTADQAHRIGKYLTWLITGILIFSLLFALIVIIIMIVRKKKKLDPIPNPVIL